MWLLWAPVIRLLVTSGIKNNAYILIENSVNTKIILSVLNNCNETNVYFLCKWRFVRANFCGAKLKYSVLVFVLFYMLNNGKLELSR